MSLFQNIARLGQRWFGNRRLDRAHTALRGPHLCRFEEMEPRQLMAADLHVGSVYYESHGGDDSTPNVLEFTFQGGAPGTQLTRIVIDGDKDGQGMSSGDIFFDTAPGGLGSFGNNPLKIVSHDGFQIVNTQVVDGGMRMVIDLAGFDIGEKLVLSIDVDEAQFVDPHTGAIDTNAVVEGGEFQRSTFVASFVAPHYHDISTSTLYWDEYDQRFATAEANSGSHLTLPPDRYSPTTDLADFTAGAVATATQIPLPSSLAGFVYYDKNLNNKQEAGENGIGGVTLTLYAFSGGSYVSTGKTTVTDGQGGYKFDALLPGNYRVVETQPTGYFSVGASAGNVSGSPLGVVTSPDIISEIALLGGENSQRNDFAEAVPNSLRGHVGNNVTGDCEDHATTPGIAGVIMHLLNSQGLIIATTTTNANGDYEFTNLAAGTYTILEEQPAGWLQFCAHAGSAGGNVVDNDTIGQIVLTTAINGIHYDFCEVLPVSIAGHVGIDAVGGQPANSSMPPIAGVTIHLLDSNGNILKTTTTDAAGNYLFTGMAPGTYGVREVQPSGYYNGDTEAGDKGGVAGNDIISTITLLSGLHAVDYDFSELLPVSIAGQVRNNVMGDCQTRPENPGIAGVTVQLLDAGGHTIATATTDAQGRYVFQQLAPGTYGVREIQPNGWLQSGTHPGTAGGTVSEIDTITSIVLTSGKAGLEYNFCEVLPVSIAGQVRNNVMGDCQTRPENPGIAGVTVHLLDASGNSIGTTVTDSTGNYIFVGLRPGTYGVYEEQPNGWLQSGTHPGSAGGAVSAIDTITQIVLASGAQGVAYNFCEVLPVSIAGQVRNNVMGDCQTRPENPGIAGVTVHLLDASGNSIGTTVTDSTGNYIFVGLRPGTYGVYEEQPLGWLQSGTHPGSAGGVVSATDTITQIVLSSGMTGVAYNFCEVLPVSITGQVRNNVMGDCLTRPENPGIAGVVVHLLDASGSSIATTVTDAGGNYSFVGLKPGTYGVHEDQPLGWLQSGTHPGSAGGTVSETDTITSIVLISGMSGLAYNFCEVLPVTISGHVGVDTIGGRPASSSMPAIPGVTLYLLDAGGSAVATTTTDASGNYVFTGMRPGTYSVREAQPGGYFNGDTEAGSVGGVVGDDLISVIVLASGAHGLEYNFSEIPPAKLAGYVFQDGPPIVVQNAGDVPNVPAVRDGKLTPDDTRLPGVVLMLRDGVTGQPILGSAALGGSYAADQPITVITDANGYYQFVGLPKGVYGVFEVKPSGYLQGIDTPGSTGGVVISTLVITDPDVLAAMTSLPSNSALMRIDLTGATLSVENNFSFVTTTVPPVVQFYLLPGAPGNPPLIAPPALPEVNQPALPESPAAKPLLVAPVLFRTGGQLYTWHLSIVDAGHPRGDGPVDAVAQLSEYRPGDEVQWQDGSLDEGEWLLGVDSPGTGKARRRIRFGAKNGTPVVGDFNGDGRTEVGMFKDGFWFIDLNDNGVWDAGDLWAKLGSRGDQPVTGDWDGDGKTDIGVYGPAWSGDPRAVAHEPGLPDPHNKNTGVQKNIPRGQEKTALGHRKLKLTSHGKPQADLIDHVFFYGMPGDKPVVGDWNGDGTHTIAVFRNGVWHRDVDGDGKWSKSDIKAQLGRRGDLPVVGDFDGDGIDELGIYRDGHWAIDTNGNGVIDSGDTTFKLGRAGDIPVVGDWNGDGQAEPGVYRKAAGSAPAAPSTAQAPSAPATK